MSIFMLTVADIVRMAGLLIKPNREKAVDDSRSKFRLLTQTSVWGGVSWPVSSSINFCVNRGSTHKKGFGAMFAVMSVQFEPSMNPTRHGGQYFTTARPITFFSGRNPHTWESKLWLRLSPSIINMPAGTVRIDKM